MTSLPLILGSSSPYRKTLLGRLQLPFSTCSPNIDEVISDPNNPIETVKQLSLDKAHAVAKKTSHAALIIASDQVAEQQGNIIGKPGNRDIAIQQLKNASGQQLIFHTGLCVLNTSSGNYQLDSIPYKVHFRSLTEQQICNYLDKEQPYDCAGSFKAESLGICLFEKMSGDDPTSLMGLPLIRLVSMLKQENLMII